MTMASWGLAPAPVAGNLVLLEPAEPTALRLAELALRAGLPDGVLTVRTGPMAASLPRM